MRHRRLSKTKASQNHFRKRSWERVGLVLNESDIVYQIQHPDSNNYDMRFIKKCSNRISKWQLIFDDVAFIVIYDKIRKCLVTIYPKSQAAT